MGAISIVIPTLNAAPALRRSLPPLAEFSGLDLIREVILADGGSSDEVAAMAEDCGALFVTGERGRGQQLRAGAAAARGEWLMFLHADTALEPDWHEAVRDFIDNPDNHDKAAYFRFALDDAGGMPRLLERIVALRCRLGRLPYGDQALLLRRDLYHRLGGFPAVPLMEDVALVRKLGGRRLRELPVRAVTSAGRYRRDGYLARMLRNSLCVSLYYLGVPPRTLLRLYG